MPARSMPTIVCRLRNTGSVTLTSAGRHGVAVASRFFDSDGSPVLEGVRSWLERPLEPGAEITLDVHLLTPWAPGIFTVRISPVQTDRFWADDIDPANGATAQVEVRDAPLPEATATAREGRSSAAPKPGAHGPGSRRGGGDRP